MSLVFVCFLSPLLAASRGGTAFVFLMILTTLVFDNFKLNSSLFSKKFLMIILPMLFSLLFVSWLPSVYQQDRWEGTLTRMKFGLLVIDPVKIICEGSSELLDQLKHKNIEITPKIESLIKGIEDGDSARIVVARTSLELIAKHPMGLDGSKEAYQKAIKIECGHTPIILISHAHNGWLNKALAIGLPGALLYFFALCNFILLGTRHLKADYEIYTLAITLISMSFVWLIRSCFDSTDRDQAIEMQIFLMPFIFSLLCNKFQFSKKKY